MSNAFKRLESDETLPKKVKRETLSNLYSIKFVMDLVDLFAVKASSVLSRAMTVDVEPKGEADHDRGNPTEGL